MQEELQKLKSIIEILKSIPVPSKVQRFIDGK